MTPNMMTSALSIALDINPLLRVGTVRTIQYINTQPQLYSQNIYLLKMLLLVNKTIQTFPQKSPLSLSCATVLICLCLWCPFKETLCVRRMFTYADGPLGSSCLNMQLTTPTTTANSVISTWASTQDTKWAEHNKHTLILCKSYLNVNVRRDVECTL